MEDIGYNDNLKIAQRTFHFQTASNSKKGEVRCEIFENGQVLSAETVEFERRGTNKVHTIERRVEDLVEALHKEMMSEVELLFLISEKIKTIKHSPSNVKMGIMFLQNNMIEDAIHQFENAIKTDPEYVQAYLYLGQTYMTIEDYKKAIQVFAKITQKQQSYADLYNHYGYALLREQQYQKAQTMLQKAIKLNSEYLEANFNLALFYFESAINDPRNETFPPPSIRFQRGMDQLEKIVGRGNEDFDMFFSKLLNLMDKKQFEQVVKLMIENKSKIFRKDETNFWGTSFFLKFMHGDKKLDNEIIEKYEQRLESSLHINDNYADIWNNLGVIHLIQCRNLFLQALNEFKRALELNPGFNKAKKNKKLVENDGKEFLVLLKAILK